MAKVFVSYSRRDSAIAEKIVHALQEAGPPPIETFLDQDLKPGEDWRKAVETAIEISDAVLVVIASPDTVGSSWTGYEIGMAEALGKPIMLLTSDRHSLSEFREDFASLPVVIFDPQTPERAAKEIIGRLASAKKETRLK